MLRAHLEYLARIGEVRGKFDHFVQFSFAFVQEKLTLFKIKLFEI